MYDRYYKLAVFGDSYADSGPPDSKFFYQSYFSRLSKMLENPPSDYPKHHPDDETLYYENLGMSGASSYWAYFNFKKYAIDLNYFIENAVMTFTDIQRLPITCNRMVAGCSWKNLFRHEKIHSDISTETNIEGESPSKNHWESVLKALGNDPLPKIGGFDEADIFSMWNLIFEDNYNGDLAKLISTHSFTLSMKIAKERNVNLVLILPFNNMLVEYLGEDPDPEITDNFMIITGLDKVSHMETRTFDNCSGINLRDPKIMNNDFFKNKTAKEVRWKDNHVDVRCNHLCDTNNQVLTDLIWQGFRGKKGLYDLSEQPGLNFDEIHNYADIIYND